MSESRPAADAPAEVRNARQLVEALSLADAQARGPDVLEARRLVARILRRQPELAAVMARSLANLRNRELAFQLARLLGRHLRDPNVRASLLDTVRGGEGVAREAAIVAFTGVTDDREVATAVAGAFTQRGADARVRAAAAFALVGLADSLYEPARWRVRDEARSIVVRHDAPLEVRIEALDLLEPKDEPADRDRIRALLHPSARPPPRLAVACARVLLAAGERPSWVRAAMERLGVELPALEGV